MANYDGVSDEVAYAAKQAQMMPAMARYSQKVQYPYEAQPTGQDGRYIRDRLLPEFWSHFAAKAADYNDDENEAHRDLGIRAQFVDINRKTGKLRKALWNGKQLVGEQPREIIMDMIGHLFITLAMMDADSGDGTPSQPAVMVAGEPWQGPTKPRTEIDLWPSCGRERCVVHPKVPLEELRAAGVVKIQPGQPENDTVMPSPRDRLVGGRTGVIYCHA